jgi:CDP-glucose 4,6-dehydratase
MNAAFKIRRVLVTGHTGFKGAWLTQCLRREGAEVCGISFDPSTPRFLHELLKPHPGVQADIQCDLRDFTSTARSVSEMQPSLVFHLAAQPLVRSSYRDPLETWSTNVLGTANLLEACRQPGTVKAVVIITTDKCYENREWVYPYRECDRLGGRDPYSASKACTEIVAASYRDSFLNDAGIAIATARAGNVIGGGDFAEDRLIPDAVRAFTSNMPLVLRNPSATRPWQHVLEPLSGYLALAEKLLSEPNGGFDTAWNFGPDANDNATVGTVAKCFSKLWGGGSVEEMATPGGPHEAGLLMLDSSKARTGLGWKPRWDLETALSRTAEWYQAWHCGEDVAELTRQQIEDYFS